MTRMVRVSPALTLVLALFPVAIGAQGVTAPGTSTTTMTEEDFQAAARRGLNLPTTLEDGFLGISVRGGGLSGLSSDWCVEYRPARQRISGCRSVAVFVDGVAIADPGAFLSSQPVEDIIRAEVLSSVDAVTRFGSRAGFGALVIETRIGQRRPADNPRNEYGFGWSPLETQPYPWFRVLGATFLANAAGFGIATLINDRCVAEDAGVRYTGCNQPSAIGTTIASVTLPSVSGGFAARWAGTTDRTQGLLAPSIMFGTMTAAGGYFLFVDEVRANSRAGKVIGAVLITVVTPIVTVLSDRIFRALR